MNKGKIPNLYFYRENKGREVDIVREDGMFMDLFEIKSSQTFNKSFVTNLNYLKQLFGDKIRESILVYDGEAIPPSIINIREISNY